MSSDSETSPASQQGRQNERRSIARHEAKRRVQLLLQNFAVWITTPNLLHGLTLGISACVIAVLAIRLESGKYIAVSLLMAASLLLVGALIGSYIFTRATKQAKAIWGKAGDHLQENLTEVKKQLVAILPASYTVEREKSVDDILSVAGRLGRTIQPFVRLLIGFLLRVAAISSLVAVLGGTLTLAIFAATYMQVERFSEQNALLVEQNQLVEASRRAALDENDVCLLFGNLGNFRARQFSRVLSSLKRSLYCGSTIDGRPRLRSAC